MNEKITALYCRSATVEQDQIQSVGLAQKKVQLLDYSKVNSLNAEVYEDSGCSGNSMERSALQKLMADIKDGKIMSVIVTEFSQLSRKATDFDLLKNLFEKHDVSLTCLQDG